MPVHAWLRPRRPRTIAGAVLGTPSDETTLDPATGAVTSRQGADIVLPAAALESLWDAEHLERAARTYWTSMRRFSLGLMRVHYSATERSIVLLAPPLRLLTFRAPEYETSRRRGVVRWRIDRGLLVSPRGRGGDGYLELEFERRDAGDGMARVHVEVEVANYYPALSGPLRWLYVHTQSRIHVLACHSFLRRLVRRDLDPSRAGSPAV